MLRFRNLRKMTFESGKTIPEHYIVPATQSEKRQQLLEAPNAAAGAQTLREAKEIVRPKFFNRLPIGLASFTNAATRIIQPEGGDIQVLMLMRGMQRLPSVPDEVFSNDLVIHHHGKRSVHHDAGKSLAPEQRLIAVVTLVRREQE